MRGLARDALDRIGSGVAVWDFAPYVRHLHLDEAVIWYVSG